MSDEKEIIEFKCPHCGCNESYLLKSQHFEEGKCVECQETTFCNMITEPFSVVRCPYCNSSYVKKISSLSRLGSVATLGFASGKVGKQWHCNNCKSNF